MNTSAEKAGTTERLWSRPAAQTRNGTTKQPLRFCEAMRRFAASTPICFTGFPDFWLDIRNQYRTEETIIVEGMLGGTHTGTWMGIAPTGKKLETPFCAVFTFTEDNRLKAEKVYYDRYSILVQWGVLASS
jgi:predicted ester cyclase